MKQSAYEIYSHSLRATAAAIYWNRPFCYIGSSDFQARTMQLVNYYLAWDIIYE